MQKPYPVFALSVDVDATRKQTQIFLQLIHQTGSLEKDGMLFVNVDNLNNGLGDTL